MSLRHALSYCLLITLVSLPLACEAGLTPGDYTFEVSVSGEARTYSVHVPRQYRDQHAALILALHGGGGNHEIQATERFYHQISASEKYGYIVMFPNGYSRLPGGKFATWNAGNCCGAAVKKQVNDVAVIRAMIQDIQQRVRINPKRIFADGISNGGMMSYRLACEMADTISAIAAVAATDNLQPCQPSQAVAILHIHAKDDDHVPFDGGVGPKSPAGVTFNSVPATIQKWVGLNQSRTPAERILEVPGAYCEIYQPGKAPVQLCVTETGGHSWPGGSKPRGGSAGSTALDANAVIWQFFSANGRP